MTTVVVTADNHLDSMDATRLANVLKGSDFEVVVNFAEKLEFRRRFTITLSLNGD